MSINYKQWRRVFLFCLGLFAGTAFCMKWMEGDFVQNDQLFTIIGLEIGYSRAKVAAILSGLSEEVRTVLCYHLNFDFAFMAGVYPGIGALCMMARAKSGEVALRSILLALAILQTVAFGCDIAENCYLLKWIKNPVIGNDFELYHLVVAVKWVIALTGALVAIPLVFRKRKDV